jgi:hypothetical protein
MFNCEVISQDKLQRNDMQMNEIIKKIDKLNIQIYGRPACVEFC